MARDIFAYLRDASSDMQSYHNYKSPRRRETWSGSASGDIYEDHLLHVVNRPGATRHPTLDVTYCGDTGPNLTKIARVCPVAPWRYRTLGHVTCLVSGSAMNYCPFRLILVEFIC